jgi:1-acyl-sn-glycerol-3-phosphate acyltransferase
MAVTHANGRDCPPLYGWKRPGLDELWRQPMPELGALDRTLIRLCGLALFPRFASVAGLENVAREADPFILAVNHCTRVEAVALPVLLAFHRGGRLVHFLADWNFQMIPGIGLLYRRSGAIVVTRKPARPRILNLLKPFYASATPSMERARVQLRRGRSVGIFTEGTVNPDPVRLLRGRHGAARLSLETGVAVVPAGIRFSGGTSDKPLLCLEFGKALHPRAAGIPGAAASEVKSSDVRSWHSAIMVEIARLSGKAWGPTSQESGHGTP